MILAVFLKKTLILLPSSITQRLVWSMNRSAIPENIFYHYLIYRGLGLLYFIVIIYLNTRALSKTKAVLRTIWLCLFEFVVIGLLMIGALFQTGKPSFIEAFIKEKGIDLKQ